MMEWAPQIVIPVLILLFSWLIANVVSRNLFDRFSDIARKTKTEIDSIVISALRTPLKIWILMIGIYLTLEVSDLPQGPVIFIGKIMLALGIFSITMVVATISSKLIKIYAKRIEYILPITSLTELITKIVIIIVGGLITLNSLGISITPILATLGVGGLAVALALQDTLSNLFAGFHVIITRQITIGDYIKLESGEEGYVVDINWRTTKVQMLPNNIVLVPNAKLAQSIVVNYYLPDRELAVLIDLGVHYKSDLKHVERVTCEVAQEIMREITGGVPDFTPFIRYHTFGEYSIKFTVILRAKEFVDQYLIKHEFIKRLHERLDREGIIIPYPIRAVNYDQEKATISVK